MIFYVDGEEIFQKPLTTYVYDSILESGLWTGQEIVFLSCSSGIEGGPAQQVAYVLGATVYAPVGKLFFKENGFFYVSDEELPIGHSDLSKEVQESRWIKFEGDRYGS